MKKRGYCNLMNLIVTWARNWEGEAEEEMMDIEDEIGNPDVRLSVSIMAGMMTIQRDMEHIECGIKMK